MKGSKHGASKLVESEHYARLKLLFIFTGLVAWSDYPSGRLVGQDSAVGKSICSRAEGEVGLPTSSAGIRCTLASGYQRGPRTSRY